MGALLVAALAAIALGGLLGFRRSWFRAGVWTQAGGSAAVAVAGFWTLASGDTLGAPFTSAFAPHVGVDGLTGFFLGRAIPNLEQQLHLVVAAVIFLSLLPGLIAWLRARARPAAPSPAE